jgi:hypothetical protein
MKTETLLAVAALLVVAGVSCSRSRDLPKELQGVWCQADPSGEMRLQLDQPNGTPEVFLRYDDTQFGPLRLDPTQDGSWRFQIAPVVQEEGRNVTRTLPPEITLNCQYIRDQDGRIYLHSIEALRKSGPVTVRPEQDGLLVQGLWVQVEFTSWDNEGKPVDQKITPRLTKFTRASPPVKIQ